MSLWPGSRARRVEEVFIMSENQSQRVTMAFSCYESIVHRKEKGREMEERCCRCRTIRTVFISDTKAVPLRSIFRGQRPCRSFLNRPFWVKGFNCI